MSDNSGHFDQNYLQALDNHGIVLLEVAAAMLVHQTVSELRNSNVVSKKKKKMLYNMKTTYLKKKQKNKMLYNMKTTFLKRRKIQCCTT